MNKELLKLSKGIFSKRKNNKILSVLFFFTLFVLFLFDLSSVSAQSDLDNILILGSVSEGNSVFFGLNNTNLMISNEYGNQTLFNVGNNSWEYERYDSGEILNYLDVKNGFKIYKKNNVFFVYKNSSSSSLFNATTFNMNNYIVDMKNYVGLVNVTLTDLAGNTIYYKNEEIKQMDGLNYILVDLSSLYDGEINIKAERDDISFESFNYIINKSSLFNTSTIPHIHYFNVSDNDYYYNILNFKDIEEMNIFLNQDQKYYEYDNLFYKDIFEIDDDNSMIMTSSSENYDSFMLYRYIKIEDFFKTKILGDDNNFITENINNGDVLYLTEPKNGYSYSVCRYESIQSCNVLNFTDNLMFEFSEAYPYLLLGYNVTNVEDSSYLDYEINNKDIYNQNDNVFSTAHVFRFSVELQPGNYTLMLNDTGKIQANINGYRLVNSSLYIDNVLYASINSINRSEPSFHYYEFELNKLSNVSFLDSRNDLILDHDIILSRYVQLNNFSKDIPIDIGISGDNNYMFSVCNSSSRNSLDGCDYYLSNEEKNYNIFFSFDNPFVFIDYNISSFDTFYNVEFNENDEYDFYFTLAKYYNVSSNKLIEINNSDKFYDIEISFDDLDSMESDISLDWNKFYELSSDKDCNVGYLITGSNEYVLSSDSGYEKISNQESLFSVNDLNFYNNYLLFRKCYNGEWIPLYPRYDFFSNKNVNKVRFVNEYTQCAIMEDDNDYYLNGDDFIISNIAVVTNFSQGGNQYINHTYFANNHQCYNGTWISSIYQNFQSLIGVADDYSMDKFSIYCDWTSNLDLSNLVNFDSNFYRDYSQGCVFKNLENNETIVSLASRIKSEDSLDDLKSFIDANQISFNDLDQRYNVTLSNDNNFVLVYNLNKFDDIKDRFGSIQKSSLFNKFINFIKNIFYKIFGIDIPQDYIIAAKDYNGIYYMQDTQKEIHSFVYANKRDEFGLPENYIFELEFLDFEFSELINLNRSLQSYHEDDDFALLDFNLSLKTDKTKGNLTIVNKNISLEIYRKFYNELIPNLRVN